MLETQLTKHLQTFYMRGSLCDTMVRGARGTISTSLECPNGRSRNWKSQKCHNGLPWIAIVQMISTNMLIAGAVVFSGSNALKSL